MSAHQPNVLILLNTPEENLAALRSAHPQAQINTGPWIARAGERLPAEMLAEVEVMFCELPPANFDDCPRLRWIQLTSAGYTQVLNLPILARGIRVTNGLGNFDVPIAEWNLMMMLWWHRHMPDAQASQRARVFDRGVKYQRELRGSTVGFYGYGGIARETARLAKAMGLKIWALTRGPVAARPLAYRVEGTGDPDGRLPDRVFGPDGIDEFLGGVDYLILSLPLTPATQGIIGERELRKLKPSAVLINCARGAIVEEQAYIRCLREGWIRGSSTDVHYAYPLPPEHPLWAMPNLIMTAHISGASGGAHFLPRAHDLFARNLGRYCSGQPLLNELSRAQLEGK
ncbi:MAG: D-2-hydroxyacid dehydrogenase [Opitutaceae bacterium]|nr:D-2-hydroxyacid dehydrogenase [Opitutaceae bacterium]